MKKITELFSKVREVVNSNMGFYDKLALIDDLLRHNRLCHMEDTQGAILYECAEYSSLLHGCSFTVVADTDEERITATHLVCDNEPVEYISDSFSDWWCDDQPNLPWCKWDDE